MRGDSRVPTPGQGVGQSGGPAGGQTAGATGQTGGNNSIFGNTGVGGQTFGGGAIVGVASKSKDPTIRLYNKKKTYDEWMFIYSPTMDLVNVLLRGPYNGQTLTGSQVGTPAGQLNQRKPGRIGQQPGGPATTGRVRTAKSCAEPTIAAGKPVSAGPEPAAIKQLSDVSKKLRADREYVTGNWSLVKPRILATL